MDNPRGARYGTTRLGEFVAERFSALVDATEAKRSFRPVVSWLPVEMEGFDVELFADAVVVRGAFERT